MRVATTVAMVRRSFAVKGFWVLWDNITAVAMTLVSRETYYAHVLFIILIFTW
jgi:hypothetical protein